MNKVCLCSLALVLALTCNRTIADDFKTVDGKEYKNAEVIRVELDGIVLKVKSGIAKVYFTELPKEVQERFHYDPDAALDYSAAQAGRQDLLEQHAQAKREREEAQRRRQSEEQRVRKESEELQETPRQREAQQQALQIVSIAGLVLVSIVLVCFIVAKRRATTRQVSTQLESPKPVRWDEPMRSRNWRIIIAGFVLIIVALGFYFLFLAIARKSSDAATLELLMLAAVATYAATAIVALRGLALLAVWALVATAVISIASAFYHMSQESKKAEEDFRDWKKTHEDATAALMGEAAGVKTVEDKNAVLAKATKQIIALEKERDQSANETKHREKQRKQLQHFFGTVSGAAGGLGLVSMIIGLVRLKMVRPRPTTRPMTTHSPRSDSVSGPAQPFGSGRRGLSVLLTIIGIVVTVYFVAFYDVSVRTYYVSGDGTVGGESVVNLAKQQNRLIGVIIGLALSTVGVIMIYLPTKTHEP